MFPQTVFSGRPLVLLEKDAPGPVTLEFAIASWKTNSCCALQHGVDNSKEDNICSVEACWNDS